MTGEDRLPFSYGETQATPSTTTPRRHRHVWKGVVCWCGAIRNDAKSRRGRQVRNYGNRAELDVARKYGGRKVGHAQGPTDVQGKTRKIQLKTTRRAVPAMWRNEFAKLESERDGRLAILLLRFVRPGSLGPDDYFVIRAADFIEWYGKDGE